MKLYMCIIKLQAVLPYFYDKMLSYFYKKAMKSCGSDVYLRPSKSDLKGLNNLSIGNNVSIPKGATFYCTMAELTIGDDVVFGPKPTIITGDHRIDVIGVPIIKSTNKLAENDSPVVIENDVWGGG